MSSGLNDGAELGVIQWVADVRLWWQVGDGSLKEQMHEFKQVASEALSLLSDEEQASVLKYFYVRDAKMSLASQLLKHLAITTLCEVSWKDSHVTRNQHGKPVYILPPHIKGDGIEFNVSHQAGLVTLIATRPAVGQVGIDVVCVNERNDYATIDKDGFDGWIDIHADVFALSEVEYLKEDYLHLDVPGIVDRNNAEYGKAVARSQRRLGSVSWTTSDGTTHKIDTDAIIEAKLRRFYALWCLREAYVKMTGEALLASWLRELEFRSFDVPCSKPDLGKTSLDIGETVSDVAIYLKGKKVSNVMVELTSLGDQYMVGSILRYQGAESPHRAFPAIRVLDLNADILSVAHSKNRSLS